MAIRTKRLVGAPGSFVPKTGAQSLINSIIYKNGGPAKCAQKLGISYQLLNTWRKRGKLPLKFSQRLARTLGVSCYALNYLDNVRMRTGTETVPSWREVVESCAWLPKAVHEKILSRPVPKEK